MVREHFKEFKDIEEKDIVANDPLDILIESIKVHTEGIDLNEDTTLSNLDQEFSKKAKYVIEIVETIGLLRSFLKSDITIIRYDNFIDKWGQQINYVEPEKEYFEIIKLLLMNKVHSILLVSRSVKGTPLKAFLTYGRDVSNKELGMEDKLGIMDRLLGKKSDEKEGVM